LLDHRALASQRERSDIPSHLRYVGAGPVEEGDVSLSRNQ